MRVLQSSVTKDLVCPQSNRRDTDLIIGIAGAGDRVLAGLSWPRELASISPEDIFLVY